MWSLLVDLLRLRGGWAQRCRHTEAACKGNLERLVLEWIMGSHLTEPVIPQGLNQESPWENADTYSLRPPEDT